MSVLDVCYVVECMYMDVLIASREKWERENSNERHWKETLKALKAQGTGSCCSDPVCNFLKQEGALPDQQFQEIRESTGHHLVCLVCNVPKWQSFFKKIFF